MIPLVLKVVRKIYGKTVGLKRRVFFNRLPPEYNGQDSSDLIYKLLSLNQPCMISRMGNIEFGCVYYHKINQGSKFTKYFKYIVGDIKSLNWPSVMIHKIQHNAGFFPATPENIAQFSQRMLSDIKEIDILGSIIDYENEFKEELKNAITIAFEDLNAYNHDLPWTKILENKRVLVIHPFTESIQKQYAQRELLFANKNVLPDFELITYKPVQSIAGNFTTTGHKDWFSALAKMEADIANIDFDIAILGCGAYGLPLAATIKRMGKKAVHIGGSVQILFGILGRRWETEYDLSKHINTYWIRPNAQEVPKNFKDVEGGCYW